MENQHIIDAVVELLSRNVTSEIVAGIGVLGAVLYKIYRIIKSDRREDSLSEEQEAFRKDILQQLVELREENIKLHNKIRIMSENEFKLQTNLRNLRLNIQVFKVILRNKVTDPNLIALFDNIACFNQLVDGDSLRNIGLDVDLVNSAINRGNTGRPGVIPNMPNIDGNNHTIPIPVTQAPC